MGNPAPLEGVRLSTCVKLETGEHFDVAVVNDGKNETILLYPLSERLVTQEASFEGGGLTEQEMAVVRLLLRKQNNMQICQRLSVSDNTLRTHLKNIYRKVPIKQKKLLMQMRKGV